MKISALLLLLVLQAAARPTATAQVTLKEAGAPLEKVLKAIKKQLAYDLFFDENLVKAKGRPVVINVSNIPVEEALRLVFQGQDNLTYSLNGKIISVKEKSEKKLDPVTEGLNPRLDPAPPPAGIDVTVTVIDAANNQTLEGASVIVKGNNKGVATDVNGRAVLKDVDPNATLLISFTGYVNQEVKIGGRNSVVAKLIVSTNELQEVVINKGYYSEKQKTSTSNVFTVKAKDIEKQPVNNPLLALVGRVPGLQIDQATGFANSGIVVRIQGRNSITSGLDPLYVIDGVPYISQPFPTAQAGQLVLGSSGSGTGGGNPLSFINPNDIESIDVLKDADATAIYGSRGANGVILITTKKGKAGKTKVTANMRSGWGHVNHKIDLLNTEQYIAMRKEGYKNDGLVAPNQNTLPDNTNYDLTAWDLNRFTDWQKELVGGTAKYTDAQLSISGGNSQTQFLVSTGYHKESTIFPGDFSDSKTSFQFNINHAGNSQKFKLQVSGTYVADNNLIPTTDITRYALTLAPNAPALYITDGSINWAPVILGSSAVSTWINPLAYLQNKYRNKINNIIGNALISYQLFPGLTIKSNFGYNYLQSNEISTTSLSSIRPELRASNNRGAQYGDGNNNSWIIEPQITYQAAIGKGKLEALLGSSFQKNSANRKQLSGVGHSSDLVLENIQAASTITVTNSLSSVYKYNALFGRINYNYQDRFIANLTARRDGSSRFGSENLFQNFWSIAGAWIFTNEKFISNRLPFLSSGKIRASYGTSGNDQIGDYGFMNLYSPFTSGVAVPYQGVPVMVPVGHTNPFLQWEETQKLQFGLDLGFLNDRFTANINYYLNRSSNLLVQTKLSVITGFGNITENFDGLVENRGWEFSFNTYNIRKKNFSWQTSFNLTVPTRNGYLASFPNIANTIYANAYTVGKSLFDTRMYHYLGVDPQSGKYQFADVHGNPTFSPTTADQIALSNISPSLYGGLQNNFTYKGIELDFTFQFVKKDGSAFLGGDLGVFNGASNTGNQPVTVLQRWQKPGDNADFQRFTAVRPSDMFLGRSNKNFNSDAGFIDASFIRLTNLSLSWQLPDAWKKTISIENAKLFVQGQNLFTITRYAGLSAATASPTVLPPLRLITLGAQITL